MTTPPRRPTPASRATRRSRRPPTRSQTFFERNRSRLRWAGAALVFAVLVGMAFLGFTRPTYACLSIFDPSPAPSFVAPTQAPSSGSPAPAVTAPPPGYVQTDMGHIHVDPGTTIRYAYCPPASGKHYNATGVGPVREGVYGPNDPAVPPGWVHNLEHGAIVLLYKCFEGAEACTDEGQAELDALYARWPNSPVCDFPPGTSGTPVIARFDDMPWPYAALVWDVVLPMESLDEDLVFEFYERQAERFNPEKLCAEPTATPGPAPTPGPATPTPGPTVTQAASPASTEPQASVPAASPAPSRPTPSPTVSTHRCR